MLTMLIATGIVGPEIVPVDPAVPTLSLALVKEHLRVDGTDEDSLIMGYLAAAKAWVENYTGRKLSRGTATQEVETLSGAIRLNWGPNPQGVSVEYIDTFGTVQTFTDVTVGMGRAFGTWPAMQAGTSAVLSYTAGYSDIPSDLVSAVLFMVGHLHANREAVGNGQNIKAVPFGIEALCQPHRSFLV